MAAVVDPSAAVERHGQTPAVPRSGQNEVLAGIECCSAPEVPAHRRSTAPLPSPPIPCCSYHQQAVSGDNTGERPMWAEKGGLDFEGRARWDAWTAVKVRFCVCLWVGVSGDGRRRADCISRGAPARMPGPPSRWGSAGWRRCGEGGGRAVVVRRRWLMAWRRQLAGSLQGVAQRQGATQDPALFLPICPADQSTPHTLSNRRHLASPACRACLWTRPSWSLCGPTGSSPSRRCTPTDAPRRRRRPRLKAAAPRWPGGAS